MPKTPRPARERDLVQAVISYINARGGYAWRMNSGMLRGVHKGKPWVVHLGVTGMPDVLGVLSPLGRLIAVECKRRPNKPTAAQLQVMEQLRARGALVVVCYDMMDVQRALEVSRP